jgi:site-specific recombinase XerD
MTEIENDKKVQMWFDLLEAASETRRSYTRYMEQFCECVGKTPTELIDEAVQETRDGKLLSERNTVGYIAKFKRCLKDKGMAPKSMGVAFACVKSFYKAYDIQLSSSIGKVKKALPLRENQNFLTKEDVTKLVTNAKSLRDKAIILVMATSGMARQEILSLRIKDLLFGPDGIGTVSIRRQKEQVDYSTFISHEAVTAVKNYFEERNRSEKLKVLGGNSPVFVDYRAGRQLSPFAFQFIFTVLAKQLGFTNGDYQIKSKSHALRKFFASTLENAGMPKNKIDFMLGHVPSGTDLAYFNTDVNKLKELYIKFLPYITFEKIIEIRSLDTKDAKRLEGLEKENTDLRQQITDIQKELDSRKPIDDQIGRLLNDPEFLSMLKTKLNG